jgi:outer membrane protein assembly factor BamB
MQSHRLLSLAACAALFSPLLFNDSLAAPRTWTEAASGTTITAEFVGIDGGQVQLKLANGKPATVALERLSPEDQAFARQAAAAASSSWPSWRGADRSGRSPDTGLLDSWPDDGPTSLWTYDDAGLGYAGFSVVDGILYTLGVRDDAQEYLIAIDTNTGTESWSTAIGRIYTNNWGDGPRSTPTIAAGHIYALGANGDLVCTDLKGKEIWKKNLVSDLGGGVPGWGYCESPLFDEGRIIVTPGGRDGTLAALDAKDGKLIWRSKGFTDDAQYASPIAIDHGGRRQYVQLTMQHVAGVDAASGDTLWKAPFPGATAVIPTPIYHDGHVYVSAGYGVGCMMVKLADDSSSAEVIYENKVMVNHHGGVILLDGHLYGYSDGGGNGWTCQDFATGERVWADRSLGKGAIHYADGHFYCLEEDSGTVALIEATTDGWKEKARLTLKPQSERRKSSGRIWTHPVIIGGKLYLRDQELVTCYNLTP